MKFKENVRLGELKPQTVLAMIIADQVYSRYGQELVITSVCDGNHSKKSLHYVGMAFDCRTNYFNEEERKAVHAEIKQILDVNYDVVDEFDHIHIEYDPK